MPDSVRYIPPQPLEGRTAPRRCEYPECDQNTRQLKPYCMDHLDEMPYVQQLQVVERMKAEETKRVLNGGRFPKQSYWLDEINEYLKIQGAKTEKAIARDLQVPAGIMRSAITVMIGRKMVESVRYGDRLFIRIKPE